jgi:outer membrane protein
MMNKKYLGLTLFIAFLTAAFAAAFVYAAELKIGYIDAIKVFDNYEKTKEQDKILEQQSDKKKQEREKLVNEVRKMKDELDVLSSKAKEQKQAQIDEKLKNLQDYDQKTRTELGQQRDKMARDILKEIEQIVNKYAEDNGYNIILNSRTLVYGQQQYDLTDKILELLNSKNKKK